jgi:hypothetical protein
VTSSLILKHLKSEVYLSNFSFLRNGHTLQAKFNGSTYILQAKFNRSVFILQAKFNRSSYLLQAKFNRSAYTISPSSTEVPPYCRRSSI